MSIENINDDWYIGQMRNKTYDSFFNNTQYTLSLPTYSNHLPLTGISAMEYFISPLINLTKYVSDNAKFRCEIRNFTTSTAPFLQYEKFLFSWFKNEAPLIFNVLEEFTPQKTSLKGQSSDSIYNNKSSKYSYVVNDGKYSIKHTPRYSILRLRNLEVHDRGFYRCEAKGDITKTIDSTGWLFVNPEPNPNAGIILPKYPELNFDGNFPILDEQDHEGDIFSKGNNIYEESVNRNDGGTADEYDDDIDIKPPKSLEDLVQKALSFDLTDHKKGHCEAYKGYICRQVLNNYFKASNLSQNLRRSEEYSSKETTLYELNMDDPMIFIKGILTQAKLEAKLKHVLEVIDGNFGPQMSPQCNRYKLPLLCFKTFPPCLIPQNGVKHKHSRYTHQSATFESSILNLPRPQLLCKNDCLALESGACREELKMASTSPGIKSHLQTCDILPEQQFQPQLPSGRLNRQNDFYEYEQLIPPLPSPSNIAPCIGLLDPGNQPKSQPIFMEPHFNGAADLNKKSDTTFSVKLKPATHVNKSSQEDKLKFIIPGVGVLLTFLALVVLACWYRNRRRQSKLKKGESHKGKHQMNEDCQAQPFTQNTKNYSHSYLEKSSPLLPNETIPLKYSPNGFNSLGGGSNNEDSSLDVALIKSTKQSNYSTTDSHQISFEKTNSGFEHNNRSLLNLVPLEKLKLQQELGDGMFGKIYKGEAFISNNTQQHHNSQNISPPTNIKIPVIVCSSHVVHQFPTTLQESHRNDTNSTFMNFIETFKKLKHNNISCLIGMSKENVSSSGGLRTFAIFEDVLGTDLHEFLLLRSPNSDVGSCSRSDSTHANETFLDQKDFVYIARNIADGMRYLSESGLIHRDLAARNCQISHNLATIKICFTGGFKKHIFYSSDYSNFRYEMAREEDDTQYFDGRRNENRFETAIPLRWMPPEVIECRKYTNETDIWSFGILLWEIFSYGLRPFYGYRDAEVADLIVKKRYLLNKPPDCPAYIYENIMLPCWDDAPYRRPSFKSISLKLNIIEDGGREKLLSVATSRTKSLECSLPIIPVVSSHLQNQNSLSAVLKGNIATCPTKMNIINNGGGDDSGGGASSAAPYPPPPFQFRRSSINVKRNPFNNTNTGNNNLIPIDRRDRLPSVTSSRERWAAPYPNQSYSPSLNNTFSRRLKIPCETFGGGGSKGGPFIINNKSPLASEIFPCPPPPFNFNTQASFFNGYRPQTHDNNFQSFFNNTQAVPPPRPTQKLAFTKIVHAPFTGSSFDTIDDELPKLSSTHNGRMDSNNNNYININSSPSNHYPLINIDSNEINTTPMYESIKDIMIDRRKFTTTRSPHENFEPNFLRFPQLPATIKDF